MSIICSEDVDRYHRLYTDRGGGGSVRFSCDPCNRESGYFYHGLAEAILI